MKKEMEDIRAQQKRVWNQFSPQWKKWNGLLMTTLAPLKDETIRLLDIEDTDNVLDIASGTGEPGLSMAAKMKNGKVMLTDLSENMLEIARENAAERGILNIDTQVCDACEMPFPDNTFDAISCRLGFMFVPDLLLSTKEMYRVLNPGSRVVLSVWDVPEKNSWATIIRQIINKHLHLPPSPPDAPGLFRCAKSGFVRNLLQLAGFKDTSEQEIAVTLDFGDAETYWNMITEVTPPLALALSQADVKMKETIRRDVLETISKAYPNGSVVFTGSTLVVSGIK